MNVTYQELLSTLPESEYDDGSGECTTCLEHGLCRDRADSLCNDVAYCCASKHGLFIEPVILLQWLLRIDAIGMDKNEDREELARQYVGDENEHD